MEIIKTEKGKTYKIQPSDVFIFIVAVFSATLVSAATLKILGII